MKRMSMNLIRWRVIVGQYPKCFRIGFDLQKNSCYKNTCMVEHDCHRAWLDLYEKRLKWAIRIDKEVRKVGQGRT